MGMLRFPGIGDHFPNEILGQLSANVKLRACDKPEKSSHGKAEK
jgi:hypothetical protein